MDEKGQNEDDIQPDNLDADKILEALHARSANYKTARMINQNKKMKWILRISILLLVIIILLLTLRQCGYLTLSQGQPPAVMAGAFFTDSTDAEDGHLPNMTIEEIKEQMQKIADASYFSFKINARPVFEDGESKGNLNIENPSYNVYPMIVQITLDDTDEVIYDSGGLYPDQHIGTAGLTKVLEAGEYHATAYMNAYDPETKAWLGRHEAELIITVKK